MMLNPYISFVVVARNDNYGGDFLNRINVFVKVLLTLCEKYELPSELIIVEWNPPEDRPRLKDAISWPDIKRKWCQIRIIEVPNEVHRNLSNPASMPLFEYIGKNVGVRRAKGEYILATNPDIIFEDKLIKFLSMKKLEPYYFYRVNRYDVRAPVPLDLTVEQIQYYCKNNIIRVCGRFGTYENKSFEKYNLYKRLRSIADYLKKKIKLGYDLASLHIKLDPLASLHTNASGDFFLMNSKYWSDIRGYPELELQGKSHHIDSLILYNALFSGLRQKIINCKIYHQDHGRPESGKPISQAVNQAFRQLTEKRKLILFNNELCGLSDKILNEEVL